MLAYPALVVVLSVAYMALPPVSTLMVARWLGGRGLELSYVPLGSIAPALPAAVVASEDARYCQHRGVDWDALREVLEEADEEGPSRGASTVPMQVAKNLFLWPGRSYIRKGMELPLALYLDLVWSKRRMMEIYLNMAEWGEGTFGAEAAAQRYFGKRARDLSRGEAALLVAALPDPILRNPGKPTGRLRARANRIAARASETAVTCLSA